MSLEAPACATCLFPFSFRAPKSGEKDMRAYGLPNCMHKYHIHCIIRKEGSSSIDCPTCRKESPNDKVIVDTDYSTLAETVDLMISQRTSPEKQNPPDIKKERIGGLSIGNREMTMFWIFACSMCFLLGMQFNKP